MQGFIDAFVDPTNMAGHISYVLLIISMMMRTMHWLRVFAISAGLFSAAYYVSVGDPISFFWESIFTLVNAVQLLILFIENRRGKFSAEEQMFIDKVLKGVERVHVRRLMKLGAWTQVGEGFLMIREETEPSHLIFVVKGTAIVERRGKRVGIAGAGDFLGEMSYLSGKNATATVISETPMRYLAFDRVALRRHLARNIEIRHAIEAGFNRNLVEKLVKTSAELQVHTARIEQDEADTIEEIARIVEQKTQPGVATSKPGARKRGNEKARQQAAKKGKFTQTAD
jgi:CRP-like cAMP-binding protein